MAEFAHAASGAVQIRPPRPPKSQKRQSAQGSQSNPSLDRSRATAKSMSISLEHLARPPDQARSDTQSHSEADFYASALEDLEGDTEGSTSDYNSDNSFTSVLDSFPFPTRSVTSTTSSSEYGRS
jgi:hypothetical protein